MGRTPDSKPGAVKPEEIRVLPMELKLGDRLSDERAEWQVVGRPYATAGGKFAHVRVASVKQPGVMDIRSWGAHERRIFADGDSSTSRDFAPRVGRLKEQRDRPPYFVRTHRSSGGSNWPRATSCGPDAPRQCVVTAGPPRGHHYFRSAQTSPHSEV
jgi:hypothetical protein